MSDRSAPTGAKRDSIVRAAYDLAQDKGFARLTVGEIARKVGMTRSLFYHYFPDRNALADAVLDLIIDSIVDELTSWNTGREEGNIDHALDDFITLMHTIAQRESIFTRQLIRGGNAELYVRFISRAADRASDYIGRTTVQDYISRHGAPITDIHETVYILLVGSMSLMRTHPDVSHETLKRIVAQMLHIENGIMSASSPHSN